MRNTVLLLSMIFGLGALGFAQSDESISSRNGYRQPVHDTLRLLYVFAEAVNDPADTAWQHPNWPRGQLPQNAAEWFNAEITSLDSLTGITKIFHQASFGKYVLLGDYTQLVQLDYGLLRGGGHGAVIDYLNNVPGEDLITQRGFSINSGDFDRWKTPVNGGRHTEKGMDSVIDFLALNWRINSKFKSNGINGGYISVSSWRKGLKDKSGFADRTVMLNREAISMDNFRHEYAHGLLGGNNFHTQGGYGTRKVMAIPGGYGLLSGHARISGTWNGWDRWRLGWKPQSHRYYISGRDLDYNEVHTDFVAEANSKTDTLILRDFVTYGDAIRIRLPYLQKDTGIIQEQFLWLENHQMLPGNVDHGEKATQGIYAYLQLGKNDTASFGEQSNYIYLLNAFGNYDLEFDLPNSKMIINTQMENPLTGYHMTMQPSGDFHDPNYSRDRKRNPIDSVFDLIYGNETVQPSSLEIDGELVPETFFNHKTYPSIGSAMDAFVVGDEISIDNNPTAAPILTYETPVGGKPRTTPRDFDNRMVHLNGISVKILEQIPNANGDGYDLKLVVAWEDFDIENDVRWTGPIHLHDSLTVKPGSEILLDQGLTPTRPVDPINFRGGRVFADPTTLIMRSSSAIYMEPSARIRVVNGSTLKMEGGSKLTLADGARLIVDSASALELSMDNVELLGRKARIVLQKGAMFNGERVSKRCVIKG